MKIEVNRESVCAGDDTNSHLKIYQLDSDATYEDLFSVLEKDNFFPHVISENEVWVLTNKRYWCIFSYYTKTGKISAKLYEKNLKNICGSSNKLFFEYYSSPERWKEKIYKMYNIDINAINMSDGNYRCLMNDGFDKEIKYCDDLMKKKYN